MAFYPEGRHRKGAGMTLAAVMLAASLLTGCMVKSRYSFRPSEGSGILPDDPIICDINNLGLDALRLVCQDADDGQNVILSPISLSTALSVLGNGAGGETRAQMSALLNSQGIFQEKYNSKYNDLLSSFYNREDVELLLANSLWVNREYPVKESFIKLAKTWYDADAFSLNVQSPSSVNEVNQWVSDKTNGMITNPVSQINPFTVMLLVNSLYFKGAWVDAFSKSGTREEDFALSTGEIIRVDMMNDQFKVPYYDAGDFKAVKLSYKGGVSMIFLRPEGDVDDLIKGLTADLLLEINEKLGPHKANLKVPRLDFTCRNEMSPYLKALGMVDAFSDAADFSEMVEVAGVQVNQVLHECRIKLDEEGTVAAAATVVQVMETSAMPETEKTVDFHLDKPFAFVIMDEPTGAVLFAGKVENPLEQ